MLLAEWVNVYMGVCMSNFMNNQGYLVSKQA